MGRLDTSAHGMVLVMIRTERLLLRRWRTADREPFAALNADPVVREYLQGAISRDASDAFVDRIEASHAAPPPHIVVEWYRIPDSR